MKVRTLTLAAAALTIAIIGVGCNLDGSKGVDSVVSLDALSYFSVDQVNGVEGFCVDLLAGQTILAGTVCYEVDVDNVLHVTYTTTDGWELSEAHFWSGCSPTGYPMTKSGNPKIGNFPYNSGDITGATTFTFSVDLSDPAFADCLGTINCDAGNVLFAMAHAALRKDNGDGTYQTETGWGGGNRVVEKGNWATQSTLTLFDDSCGGGDGGKCYEEAGTAFAFDGDDAGCFQNFPEFLDNPSRWGWTNGPLLTGTYTWDVYYGAAKCDLEKGTFCGTATLSYDAEAGTATVTFDLVEGFALAETHIYVGCGLFPLKDGEATLAPGQYPYKHEFAAEYASTGMYPTSDSYEISGIDNSCEDGVYAIFHAKVMQQVPCAE